MILTDAASLACQMVLNVLSPTRMHPLRHTAISVAWMQMICHAKAHSGYALPHVLHAIGLVASFSRNCCRCFGRDGCFFVRSDGRGPWWRRLERRRGGGLFRLSKSNNFRATTA